MSDTTIKCSCPHCGVAYRLPVEAAGRSARCKKCGQKFDVPRDESLEDSILAWLSEPDDEESVEQPRVINMPSEANDPDAAKRARGPIRMKSGSGH